MTDSHSFDEEEEEEEKIDFLTAARDFYKISQSCQDSWKIYENANEIYKTYLKKEHFLYCDLNKILYKSEFIIFYNQSYAVPTFSFNIWNCEGRLLNLEEIRDVIQIKFEKDFYSVVTQQEHPILHRPYFIIHPCHTEKLLSEFKNQSKNIIVTFLGLITPLIPLDLPMDYGL